MTTDVSAIGARGTPSVTGLKNYDLKSGQVSGGNPGEFSDLMKDKIAGEKTDEEGLQFSAHAIKRMAERKIELNPMDMQKIREALAKVGQKGARESLILSDKGAFIVNVKDQKVITAMDPASARDSTFTNIDSTVII